MTIEWSDWHDREQRPINAEADRIIEGGWREKVVGLVAEMVGVSCGAEASGDK